MNSKRSTTQSLASGAGAGVVASLVMAMYAMISAWAQGTGFFTPLHHIASLIAPPDAMMASIQAAAGGSDFHFAFGTAIVGAMVHMMTGAMYGAVFGLIASRLTLSLGMLAGAGLVYGAVVFAMSAFIGLPLAASIFGAGDPIADMAKVAGWGTFIVEHLIFGLTLGILVGALARRRADVATLSPAHAG